MSDHVNKPETGFKTQEEIKLKVSDGSADAGDGALPDSQENSDVDAVPAGSKSDSSSRATKDEDMKPEPSKDKTSETKMPDADDESSNLSAQKIASVGSKSDDGDNVQMQFHKPSSSGQNRHRAIVAVCAVLSCSLLGLSLIDLKHLIGRSAYIDESLNVTYLNELPELPPAYSYIRNEYSNLPPDLADMQETAEQDSKLLSVIKHTWNGRKYGYADRAGKVVIPAKFDSAGEFNDGLASAQIIGNGSPKYGYIDDSGDFKIPPQFDNARRFRKGLAVVVVDGLSGLIDKTGHYVVKPSLRDIQNFSENYLATTPRGKLGILSPTGKWILPPEYSHIYPIMDENRRLLGFPYSILRDRNSYYRRHDEKIFKAKTWLGERYGLVNLNGTFILPPRYDDVLSFNNGIAAVKVDGKIGFVKLNGDYVIRPQFDQTTPYADLIAVRNHGTPWSFINKTGTPVNGPSIQDIVTNYDGSWFNDGLSPILQGGKIGYMNAKGVVVIKPQFDFGMPFVAGHAFVWVSDSWRAIDTSGRFVPGFALQDISVFFRGHAHATVPGPFNWFVEYSRIRSINESIKQWIENFKVREPTKNNWGEE